eukprot:scaffold7111_cov22-Cyclotella_meneghiniana.AAC.1
MAMATAALAEKFGVASHRVSSNVEEGDHSSRQYIQQTVVSILDRVQEGHQRSKMMDFMDICTLPKLSGDLRSTNPVDWWDESETNIWTDWDRCSITQVKAWQFSINKRFSPQDQTASIWLYLFVYNSSTHALRTEVNKKYNRIRKNQRGGVCYLYLTLCEMFHMSREVKDAMYTFLRLFRTKGIGRYTGENVLKASSEVLGICKRLEAANALLDDHVYDVLCGLSICTSARFRDTFRFLKQSEDASGHIQLPGIPPDATTMEIIEAILLKAEGLYDKLCTAGLWNKIKGGGADLNALVSLVHACWNCGSEEHRVGDCPKARNEETIAKNRQAFNDAKRSAGRGNGGRNQNGPQLGGRGRGNGGRGGRGGRGNGNRDATTSPDYQCKVWEAAGIVVAEGVALISCKTCGMNATHGTNHHSAYVSNPSSFSLPATHPLHTARQFAAKNGALVPYRPPANQQQPGPAGGTGSANTLTIDRSEFENRLATFERNSTDPNADTTPSVWIIVLGLSLVSFCLLVVPGFAAGVPLRPPKRRKRRSARYRSSGLRYRRFQRRHLHYCSVQRCYRRVPYQPLLGPRIRQHRRWRRRRDHKRPIYRFKRRQFRMNAFLQPLTNSYALWNSKRVVDAEFIDTAKTTFLPHANHGYVSEEALNEFCSTRGDTFLAATRLMKKFDQVSLGDQAQSTVHRYNLLWVNNSTNNSQGCKHRKTPKNCPLVNDIARSNTVIGMGTTLHKFRLDGDDFFLPCLSYHLPTAE